MGVCDSKIKSKNINNISEIEKDTQLILEKQNLDIKLEETEKKIKNLQDKNSEKLKLALEEKKKNNKGKVTRLLKEIKVNKKKIEKLTSTNGMLKDRQNKLDDILLNNEMTKITKKNNELITKNMESQEEKVNIIKKAQDVNMQMDNNQNNLNDMVKVTKENLISEQDLDDEFNKLGESELLDELEKFEINKDDINKNDINKNNIQEKIIKKKLLMNFE